eukprot:TRINITY_DN75602_c0_g1_i1.p1 TRINITY_DN75602_c0_g1~~TRINITY_DN75602_c0_g1_i1.p1  ORF type:complete len:169 (+),score=8.65 TRINITY_DN75602_c0_g1_i1:86-592(+)
MALYLKSVFFVTCCGVCCFTHGRPINSTFLDCNFTKGVQASRRFSHDSTCAQCLTIKECELNESVLDGRSLDRASKTCVLHESSSNESISCPASVEHIGVVSVRQAAVPSMPRALVQGRLSSHHRRTDLMPDGTSNNVWMLLLLHLCPLLKVVARLPFNAYFSAATPS